MGKRPAKRTIDSGKPMEKPTGLPDFNTNAATGIYRLVYLVYAPEHPKGQGIIQIELPNKREFNKCRRQIKMRRRLIKFTNSFGEPQIIQVGPNTISITTEKYEIAKVDAKGKEKSRIILPSQEAISQI